MENYLWILLKITCEFGRNCVSLLPNSVQLVIFSSIQEILISFCTYFSERVNKFAILMRAMYSQINSEDRRTIRIFLLISLLREGFVRLWFANRSRTVREREREQERERIANTFANENRTKRTRRTRTGSRTRSPLKSRTHDDAFFQAW